MGDRGPVSPAMGGGAGRWGLAVTPHSAPPAWPCPENTACAPDGPGLVQCLCNSPFHGYKCLREVSACQTGPPTPSAPHPTVGGVGGSSGGTALLTSASSQGTFPVLLFCGILGAVTLSLSLLLWGTQRRKAKTP